jgi:hypothetical protein
MIKKNAVPPSSWDRVRMEAAHSSEKLVISARPDIQEDDNHS